MSMRDWAELLNRDPHALYDRKRLGWDIDKLLSTPTKLTFAEGLERHRLARRASYVKRAAAGS